MLVYYSFGRDKPSDWLGSVEVPDLMCVGRWVEAKEIVETIIMPEHDCESFDEEYGHVFLFEALEDHPLNPLFKVSVESELVRVFHAYKDRNFEGKYDDED